MSLDPEDIEALSEQLSTDTELLHQIVHGNDSTTVPTESGGVPSLAKFYADNGLELDGKQDKTALLTAIIGAAAAADKLMYFTGDASVAVTAFTAAARGLLAGADTAAMRDVLSVSSTSEMMAAITAAVDALIDGAPGALDTLSELAAALNDDAGFAAAVTTSLAGKQASHANLTALAGLASIANLSSLAGLASIANLSSLANLGSIAGLTAIAALATTAFGRARLTDANAAAARAALALSSADDVTFNRLTLSSQPAFFAKGLSTVQSGPNIPIQFATPSVNVGGHWSVAAQHFTCPVSGRYRVDFNTLTNGGSADTWIMLLKNGVSVADGYSSPGSAPNQFLSVGCSAVIDCAANDILAFWLRDGSVYTAPYTYGSIILLG